jgi:hypothetical protein
LAAPSEVDTPNEVVYGIWNTTVGGNSSISVAGSSTGNYYQGEPPMAVFDGNISSNYNNFGACNYMMKALSSGLNTGFYITLINGPMLLRAFRIRSGHYKAERDPLIITLETSNHNNTLLTLGSSWTLIYNDSSGLTNVTDRNVLGQTQMIINNSKWYSSDRLLVSAKKVLKL